MRSASGPSPSRMERRGSARGLGDLGRLLGTSRLPTGARDLALRGVRPARGGGGAGARLESRGREVPRGRLAEVGRRGRRHRPRALRTSAVDTVAASPVPFGHGAVDTSHGRLAVPTPATLELLRGVPVEPQDDRVSSSPRPGRRSSSVRAPPSGSIPAMTVDRVGYGAGDLRNPAIVLRVVIGTS